MAELAVIIPLPNRDEQGMRDMAFRSLVLLGLGLATLSSAVNAAETITYKYDARGRVIEVKRTGTVNNNVTTSYTHDKADNRTNTTTTGSPN